MRYLYVFGYETPRQLEHNASSAADDEDSAAIFIEAPSLEAALAWGRAISEQFFILLHDDPSLSWTEFGYAHWIEEEPEARFGAEALATVPTVRMGEYPDWITMGLKDHRDRGPI
ncbi:MAG: hypothetical protein ACRELA_23535 [Candidatus Rokuibacteriota bacterium]